MTPIKNGAANLSNEEADPLFTPLNPVITSITPNRLCYLTAHQRYPPPELSKPLTLEAPPPNKPAISPKLPKSSFPMISIRP
jgi:hypothetical protein